MLDLKGDEQFEITLNSLLSLQKKPNEKTARQNLVLMNVIQNSKSYLELCNDIKNSSDDGSKGKMTDFKIVRSLFESSINTEL
jgi:hypothetical protein